MSLSAMRWFKDQAKKVRISGAALIREYDKSELRHTTQVHIGGLYYFIYDPKLKATLPYYDRFPCIFLTDMWIAKDGKRHFAGINLHYLPYKQRVLLMDALLDLENNAKMPKHKRLKISYGIMKSAAASKWFRPCYKRYLNNHVRSRLVRVPYEEWRTAVFLPVAEFEKASQAEVWADSVRKMK